MDYDEIDGSPGSFASGILKAGRKSMPSMPRTSSKETEKSSHATDSETSGNGGSITWLERQVAVRFDTLDKKLDELLRVSGVSTTEILTRSESVKVSHETRLSRLLQEGRPLKMPRQTRRTSISQDSSTALSHFFGASHDMTQSEALRQNEEQRPNKGDRKTTIDLIGIGGMQPNDHMSSAAKRLFEKRATIAPTFQGKDGDLLTREDSFNSEHSNTFPAVQESAENDKEESCSRDQFGLVPGGEITHVGSTSSSTKAARDHVHKARKRGQMSRVIWNFFEDPESSTAAAAYDKAIQPCLTLCVFFTVLQSVRPGMLHWTTAFSLESCIECLFATEIIVRFLVCPSRRGFLHNPFNLIDIFAVLPLFLRIIVVAQETRDTSIPRWFDHGQDSRADKDARGRWISFVLLGVVPVLRLLKTLRKFLKFRLLLSAFATAFEALPCLLFTMFIVVLSFSSLIYLVEERDNINTTGDAMWLTIATISTVGYGDTVPKSSIGRVVVIVLIISGVMYMAMPLGIIGYAFTEAWAHRDHILLIEWVRRNLLQWGYSAQDIPILFEVFDADEDGVVSLPEFVDMISAMNIGISEHRVLELFAKLDKDGSGGIDAEEFVRDLFPGSYKELFGARSTPNGSIKNEDVEPIRRISFLSNVAHESDDAEEDSRPSKRGQRAQVDDDHQKISTSSNCLPGAVA